MRIRGKKNCDVEGCGGKHYSKRLCCKHYGELRRVGVVALNDSESVTFALGTCVYEGCDSKAISAGYCSTHYYRIWRNGTPDLLESPWSRPEAVEARFWEKVLKTEDCWLWKGHKDEYDKGKFIFDGKPRAAHRYSFMKHYGVKLPQDTLLRNLCGTPSCVRPDHWKPAREISAERKAA